MIGVGKLPLDDPRWLAMRAEIDRREKQTGDRGLAIRDLERDLAAARLTQQALIPQKAPMLSGWAQGSSFAVRITLNIPATAKL